MTQKPSVTDLNIDKSVRGEVNRVHIHEGVSCAGLTNYLYRLPDVGEGATAVGGRPERHQGRGRADGSLQRLQVQQAVGVVEVNPSSREKGGFIGVSHEVYIWRMGTP